ncbi:MAG: hypothetical protein ACLQOQ_20885 [Beijerinckiaceae bacterium]
MTNQAKPTLATSHADLLHVLNELVERDRAEAAECGFTDDEMSWLEEGQRAIANARALASTELADEIAISWHIDDVREIRPDLTDEQCREVLQQAERRHDASVGINWEVLAIHADDLFPNESEAQEA